MANDYYTHGGYPATGSQGASSSMRAELDLITAGFDKMATLAGNAGKFIIVNSSANGQSVSSQLTETAGLITIAAALTVGTIVSAGTAFRSAAGTAAAPSYSFTADTDTGIFRTGADGLGIATGGVSRFQVTSTAIASLVAHGFAAGSAAAPSIMLSADPDSGLFSSAANVLGFAVAGVEHANLSTISFTKIASSAGLTSPNSNYDDLTVSSNANSGLTLISGTTSIGGVMFQDSADGQLAGRLQYSHVADTLTFYAGNSVGMTLGGSTLDIANTITSSGTARFNGAVYGALGIRDGGAYGGAGAVSTADGFVVESSGASGISILTPNSNSGTLRFGDPEDNDVGGINYLHSTDTMSLVAGGTTAASLSSALVNIVPALTSGDTARFNGATLGFLGIREGGAYGGAGPNTSVDGIVLEANGNTGISVLTPNTSTGQIRFGDSDNNAIGGFSYAHSTDTLSIVAGGTSAVSVTSASVGLATGVDLVMSVSTGPSSIGSMGFRGVPQNSRSANYTLVLEDAGKHIYHPSGGGAGDVFTIPANSSVAYPIGTAITFVNLDSNSVSIAITTDTMTLIGAGSTGTRTLAQYGMATALKVSATAWVISGTNLT